MCGWRLDRERGVPTLFRLLLSVGLIAAAVYGGMLAMVTFLHPRQREITQTVVLPPPVK